VRCIPSSTLFLTFAPAPRTLLNVAQGQFRTLINLVVVFGLLGTFLWGGSRLLNALTGSDQAASAAPTPQAVIEQPGAFDTPIATPRGGTHAPIPSPTPTVAPPTDTPAPTPTPKAPPKVIISLSALGDNPTHTITLTGGLVQVYCLVRNSALPPGPNNNLVFSWLQGPPPAFFSYPEPESQGVPFTLAYYKFTAPGKYRCEVVDNGQSIDGADFTLQ